MLISNSLLCRNVIEKGREKSAKVRSNDFTDEILKYAGSDAILETWEVSAVENHVLGFYAPEAENGYLGNGFPMYFDYAGQTYCSAEQFLMAQKAIVFGDYEMYEEIMLEHDPEALRALGREIMNYDDAVWEKLRQPMMRRGIRAKFQQNQEWMEKLLATGDQILAECVPQDTVWGIGLPIGDPRVQNPHKWGGENLLGKTLMQVREDLRLWKAVSGGNISYIDATDAEPDAIWSRPIAQVMQLPEYRDALDIYFEITLYRLRGDRFFYDECNASLAELENLIAGEMGGGLPAAWFFEMKQDIYDITRFKF